MSSDMGDMFREMREYRKKQIASGKRLSNRYRTEDERDRSIKASRVSQNKADQRTLKELKALGINAKCVSSASFQLLLPTGNVMFYSGKNGDFVYIPSTNQKIEVDLPLSESLPKVIKELKSMREELNP